MPFIPAKLNRKIECCCPDKRSWLTLLLKDSQSRFDVPRGSANALPDTELKRVDENPNSALRTRG